MADATTLIIGASHAGVQTAASLRDNGYDGRIVMISDEAHLPYHRPPLSKTLAKPGGAALQVLRSARFFEDRRIEFVPDTRIASLAPVERRVVTADGAVIDYDALVLATGARPLLPPIPGRDLDGVMTLRSLDDALRLGEALQGAGHVAIIGGGMIGLEFAAVAAGEGRQVTVIEAAPRILGRAVSAETANQLAAEHRRRGVTIVTGDSVLAIEGEKRVSAVVTKAGLRVPADLVLIAVGAIANAELAGDIGIGNRDGIQVDAGLATTVPGIYAVGDCAHHPSTHAGAAMRIESVQNATDQGRTVAAALTGGKARYTALPWFWSDQYELKLQIAGITQGHDLAVSRRDGPDGRLTVFCFRQGRLVGVESINNARTHMAARRLLGAGMTITAAEAADPDFDIGAAAKLIAAAE
ncbi:MAG TPA: FAD-dependent oxidoreductase [Kaistia sp.]|nr:FAD-dependent oxidoreductase [Kaistia sp.]